MVAATFSEAEELSLKGWILRGAIREDDAGTTLLRLLGTPSDDPFGNINRFCNHFLDPVVDRGPGVGRAYSGVCPVDFPLHDAAQWALGSLQPFAAQPPEEIARRNHYSVVDARESMWRALTLRDGAGAKLSSTVDGMSFSFEEVRKLYWATTFRALGDVVHSVQDMGQPQHTRNEAHASLDSGYEKYIEARVTRQREYKIDGVTLTSQAGQLPDLTYDGYSIPRFARYSDYWSSRLGPNSNDAYLGLADYSNRGFFALRSNIGDTTYPMPSPNPSSYGRIRSDSSYFGVLATYLVGGVPDDLTNSLDTITMSTEGVFAGLIGSVPTVQRGYGLSRRNYDDRANLLIRRAVAYSAGVLDYFFRGTMQISLPSDGVYAIADHSQFNVGMPASGFTKVKLKLANTTPAIGTGPGSTQDMAGGKLVAVVKFRRNGNYASDLSKECGSPGQSLTTCRGTAEEIVVSTSVKDAQGNQVTSVVLPAGGTAQEFQFTFADAIPLNVTDVYLQVVYRGALGSEADAVVVTTKNIPEPTYLSIFNVTDSTTCVNGTWVKLNQDGSVPEPYYTQIVTAGGNPTALTLETFSRVGVTFKPPFTYPLSDNSPPVTAFSVAPGQFIRMAVLTDDLVAFDYDIQGYQFYDPYPFVVEWNGIDYDSGTPTSYTSNMKQMRGINTFGQGFGYRFFGSDCNTNPNWPTDSTSANGGSYATPSLVPIDALTF